MTRREKDRELIAGGKWERSPQSAIWPVDPYLENYNEVIEAGLRELNRIAREVRAKGRK